MTTRWDDPRLVGRLYERERLTDAVTPHLLGALALHPGQRVVDIGCGLGGATLAAAAAVGPGGLAAGLDVSASLVAEASVRATRQGVTNVQWQVADAQSGDFDGAPYDVAMSRFGVMFFDDPVAAFANIRGQLAAGGRLGFACWQPRELNPWFLSPVLADLLPDAAAPTARPLQPGPFSLRDPALVTDVLDRAGYRDIDVRRCESSVDVPEVTVIDEPELSMMGVAPDRVDEAWQRVRDALAPYRTPDQSLSLPIAFFIVTATA